MITAKDMDDLGIDYYTAPPTPKPPTSMVKEFARLTGQTPDPELYATLISEEFDEWATEYFLGTKEAQLKELADLLYVIYGYANAKGWDVLDALHRVHSNNIGRCLQPDGSVKRRNDGKIMKNEDYPKVDLGDLV